MIKLDLSPNARDVLDLFFTYFDDQWMTRNTSDDFLILNQDRRITNAIESFNATYYRTAFICLELYL